MRLTQVTGMPVVDTHVARQAGVVSDVLLDLRSNRLAVLNVKHGDGWVVQRIPAAYVYRLGPRSVLVADSVAVDLGPPSADQCWFPIASLVGLRVLTEGGDDVGWISDADLDEQTLAVKTYFLKHARAGWRWRSRILPQDVVSCSSELMLVRQRTK